MNHAPGWCRKFTSSLSLNKDAPISRAAEAAGRILSRPILGRPVTILATFLEEGFKLVVDHWVRPARFTCTRYRSLPWTALIRHLCRCLGYAEGQNLRLDFVNPSCNSELRSIE
jgi:hypothetical protein